MNAEKQDHAIAILLDRTEPICLSLDDIPAFELFYTGAVGSAIPACSGNPSFEHTTGSDYFRRNFHSTASRIPGRTVEPSAESAGLEFRHGTWIGRVLIHID